MNNDARISVALPAHPKTKKLARRLGPAGPWGLVCLFLWAAQNRPDGSLAGMTDEDIELSVDWGGDDGALVAALASVGFLDGEEGARTIHDWEHHNPWAFGSERRAEKAKFAALCKQHGREQASKMMPDYVSRTAPPPPDPPSGVPVAVLRAPSEQQGALPLLDSGSAPSPSPSPSPSPTAGADASSPSGTRLAKDWSLPDTWRQEAKRTLAELHRDDIDISLEASRFRDYWVALPGAKGRKTDWLATWRNWVRKACEYQRAGTKPKPVITSQPNDAERYSWAGVKS